MSALLIVAASLAHVVIALEVARRAVGKMRYVDWQRSPGYRRGDLRQHNWWGEGEATFFVTLACLAGAWPLFVPYLLSGGDGFAKLPREAKVHLQADRIRELERMLEER